MASLPTATAIRFNTPRNIQTALPLGAMLTAITLSSPMSHAQTPSLLTTPIQEATLPTIDVKSTRTRETIGYQAEKTSVGKIPQALRDIPQAVTVVTEQLIHDRNADTLKEALRNVAGLTFNAGEGGRIGDNVTLRGYSLVGDLYLDGMRDIAQYNREIFNLEQVDVLRGSASMLFGRGSTGGVVNQVTKKPTLSNQNEASLTVGTDNYLRGTADLNRVLGDKTAVRLNVMKTDADSFRNGVHNERWAFAPTLGWGIESDNEFSLAYYRLKADNVPDYGVPYFNGQPLAVPTNRFYGMSNADYQTEDTGIATASYTHHFAPHTRLRSILRQADYDRDLWAVAPRLVSGTTSISDNTIINRQRQARGGAEHTLTSQTDFNTTIKTGKIEHQLLIGLELLNEKANRWTNTSSVANPTTTVGNPTPFVSLPAGYNVKTRTSPNSYTADTIGFYGQDMLEITPQWKLLVGARHDDFKADYDRSPTAAETAQGIQGLVPYSRTDRVWSYRTGLIFQPTDMQSYYVSYGSSFNPSAELYQLDDRSKNTPPEKNRNIELGAKWDLLDGNLSFRSALFRSEKTNERNTDLGSPDIYLLSGKRHTNGIEFELTGRITSDWEIFGGWAIMHANIDAAAGSNTVNLNKRPINTPSYTANIWSTYKLNGGWKIGGGFEAVGKRYGNATNTNEAPAYVRWDALVEYQAQKYAIKLNAFNLFNQTYYEGIYAGHVTPGTARTAQLSVAYRF